MKELARYLDSPLKAHRVGAFLTAIRPIIEHFFQEPYSLFEVCAENLSFISKSVGLAWLSDH